MAYSAMAAGTILVVMSVTAMRGDGSAGVARTVPTSAVPQTTSLPADMSPIETQHGGPISYDGKQYTVGDGTDLVLQGDWDCDGTTTIAVLRPTTGALFVFESWADASHDVTASPTTYIDIGATLETLHDGACDTLTVIQPDGSAQEVGL